MALAERINKAMKPEKGSDVEQSAALKQQITELMPERDADLLATRQAERDALTRFEAAHGELAAMKPALDDAAGAVRAKRLLLAEGGGSEEDLAKAKRALDAHRDRLDGHADLVEALGARLADARERTRQAELAARRRSREALTAIAATNVQARLALYEQLEALVAEAGAIWSAYEVASPPVPCVIGRCGTEPVVAHRPEGRDARLAALLTPHGEVFDAVVRPQALFVRDPYAPGDGPLFRWKQLAFETFGGKGGAR